MARTNDMPEKNSSDGTLNLNMDIMLQFWKKKIHAMTMHGYRVSPHPPPSPATPWLENFCCFTGENYSEFSVV